MITIFRSVTDISVPYYKPIETVLERIKKGKSKDLVKSIREKKDKSERNPLKKKLPAICFSGKFSTRADNAMLEHSGFICLDFDGYKSKKDMLEFKEDLKEEEFVYSVFISPSGNGLKVLVKIPPVFENHRKHFNALESYFDCEEFDTSCKNESRVCYESYDPKIYINEDSVVYEDMQDEKVDPVVIPVTPIPEPTIAVFDHNEIIRRLMIWWERDFGFVDGEKNNNLHKLACALCNYGVSEASTLSHIIMICRYDSSNAPQSELIALVKSAYKTATFNNKVFEDKQKVESIRKKLKTGITKSEVREELEAAGVDKKEAKVIVEKVDEIAHDDIQVFWNKSDKGKVSILHNLFREFLTDNGFFKFYPEGSKNFVFVRRISNRVSNATGNNIKDFVLSYLDNKCEDSSVWNFFADNTRFFKEDFLSLLPDIEINFIEDTAEDSFLFYKNVTVHVTKDEINTIEYEDLDGWVWDEQIIERDYIKKKESNCDFRQFIGHVSGEEPGRIESIESTIGFLLHGYKDPGYCPAVIINDEVISDNPEGGTGKGIFVNALSQLKKKVGIDGKSFAFDKSFPYQTVSVDTQILAFDDVKSSFDFERLFSLITEGITLEKKNKDAIKVPFSKSPKIVITTNYAIRGSGNSFERRKWELEFKQFYRRDRTPVEVFGHRLFDDWDESEYAMFDNYMLNNIKGFLNTGFVKSAFKNLKARKFIAETSHAFYEWMGDIDNQYARANMNHNTQSAFVAFTNDYSDYRATGKLNLSKINFNRWMVSYADYKFGTTMETGRSANGKWVMFVEKKSETKQKKIKL